MSDLLRDDALVLRCIPYSETSLILTVFTANHGKLGLMYKGGRRKVKNGTSLVLEPGYEVEVVWSVKATRELQLVRELALTNAHFGIRSSLDSTAIASSLVELLLRTISEDDPHPRLFGAATEVLRECETAGRGRWPLFWKFYVVLLEQLGFALSAQLIAERSDTRLGREAKAILTKLLSSDFSVAVRLRVSPQAEREIHRFLIDYLSGHLHGPAQPRTMDSLRWIRRPLS